MMSLFTYMETHRNDVSTPVKLAVFKSANIASNIMQYSDMLTQYVTSAANYSKLHQNDYTSYNNVGQVTILDYNGNSISDYSQKNLKLFLNYTSAVFNYGTYSSNQDTNAEVAKLYLVTSFSDYVNDISGYKSTSLDQVMGELADKYSHHLYQGTSVSWVVPILLKQDGDCNVIAMYGQVVNDSNNMKQIDKISTLFNRFCRQLQNQGYTMQKYVYIANVMPTSN